MFISKLEAQEASRERIEGVIAQIEEKIDPLLKLGRRGNFMEEISSLCSVLEIWERTILYSTLQERLSEQGWNAELSTDRRYFEINH